MDESLTSVMEDVVEKTGLAGAVAILCFLSGVSGVTPVL